MANNKSLLKASKVKHSEFYTQLEDIENELQHYKEHFKDKVVYCNCDNPFHSNFFKYFVMNFNEIGLKRLVCTNLEQEDTKPYKAVVNKVKSNTFNIEELFQTEGNTLEILEGNGDFRSEECTEILKQADIVVGNPPFFLLIDYINQLYEYRSKFLIIGNINAIPFKDIFPLIKSNQLWLGVNNKQTTFEVPNTIEYSSKSSFKINKETGRAYVTLGNICWFTNLDHNIRNKELNLTHKYNEEDYPKYDNYDVINVDRVAHIPTDYYGVMGVPLTFLTKYNPKQFDIIGVACGNSWSSYKETLKSLGFNPNINYKCGLGIAGINGKAKYVRLFIKRK